MIKKRGIVIVLFVILFIPLVLAHTDGRGDPGLLLKERAVVVLIIAAGIIVLTTLIALAYDHHKTEETKWLLFLGIVFPALFATIFIAATTVYVNSISATNGPVHWHADFEIWNCDEKVDLIGPLGLSNRVGTSTFHEHGDNRIHLEGVPVDLKDYTLHHFFDVVGGKMTEEMLTVPINEGMITMTNGNTCHSQAGRLQVFVYTSQNKEVQQQKIEFPTTYLMSPQTQVPPGDCLIIEFAEEKETTEHICNSYALALEKGELYGR